MGVINQLLNNNPLSPESLRSIPPLAGAAILGLSLGRSLLGFEPDIFIDSKQGHIIDPYSGDTYFFSTPEERNEALTKMAEAKQNYLKERLRTDLLLASGGSPEQVESIYKSTSPTHKGKLAIEDSSSTYYMTAQNAVSDAVLASASGMTLSDLKRFASRYPGLNGLITERESEARKAGLNLVSAEFANGNDVRRKLDMITNLRERVNLDRFDHTFDQVV